MLDFDVGEDYYGEQVADQEDGSPDNKSKKTGAKYKKAKSKKKKRVTPNPDDSTVQPALLQKAGTIKKK